MGVVLWITNLALSPLFIAGGWRYLALTLLVVISVLAYFGLGQLFGAFRLAEFKSALRRG